MDYAKIKISFLSYRYSCRLADLDTAPAADTFPGLKRKGPPVPELKNIHRADLNTFLISYTFARIDFDFKHNMLFPGPDLSKLVSLLC